MIINNFCDYSLFTCLELFNISSYAFLLLFLDKTFLTTVNSITSPPVDNTEATIRTGR